MIRATVQALLVLGAFLFANLVCLEARAQQSTKPPVVPITPTVVVPPSKPAPPVTHPPVVTVAPAQIIVLAPHPGQNAVSSCMGHRAGCGFSPIRAVGRFLFSRCR